MRGCAESTVHFGGFRTAPGRVVEAHAMLQTSYKQTAKLGRPALGKDGAIGSLNIIITYHHPSMAPWPAPVKPASASETVKSTYISLQAHLPTGTSPPWAPPSQERMTTSIQSLVLNLDMVTFQPKWRAMSITDATTTHSLSCAIAGCGVSSPTRPTSVCPHSAIVSAASRSPSGEPIRLLVDCDVSCGSTDRVRLQC